jgi:excisionase family DNA binding protein
VARRKSPPWRGRRGKTNGAMSQFERLDCKPEGWRREQQFTHRALRATPWAGDRIPAGLRGRRDDRRRLHARGALALAGMVAGMTRSPLLTISDVAQRFGVTDRTVGEWIRSNELPAVNASRRTGSQKPRLRIRPEDVELFEAARSTATTAATPGTRRRTRAYRQVL